MEFSAKGMRVLVTAGAAGIGRVIARTFHDHGATVHICDIDEKALPARKTASAAVTQTVADVAKLEDVERLFKDVEKHLRGLDVPEQRRHRRPDGQVEDIRPEDWDRTIAIDLNGMFYCTRKAMPLIKKAGGGSIINLSSIAGRFGFRDAHAVLGREVGRGRLHAEPRRRSGAGQSARELHSAWHRGGRAHRLADRRQGQRLGVSPEEEGQDARRRAPLLTVTQQDIANMALFLATAPGRHISGQAIAVCGGARYLV